jgi:hypothetical protein
MRRIIWWALAGALLLATSGTSRAAFTTFESGQVRPLALSPDGTRLFAVNTPDDRLEIFDVSGGGFTHVGSVPVGLEPVAVAARSNTEVWVVNHLSDSISIVDVGTTPPTVARTLPGDESRARIVSPTGRRARSSRPRTAVERPGAGRNVTIGTAATRSSRLRASDAPTSGFDAAATGAAGGV